MKQRRNRLMALMLSAAMIVPSISAAMPVYAEEISAETEAGTTDESIEDAEESSASADTVETVETTEVTEEEVTDDESAAVDAVKALIEALPEAGSITTEDADQIAEAERAFEALSAEDQAALDTEPLDGGQPYGRVLQSAGWELASLQIVDNSTTLPAGTYTTETTPAYTVTSDKGKSTSSRNRTWTWTSITVDENGLATGTLKVDSASYPSVQVNGQSYTRDENSASRTSSFLNIPVDLNSTMYISATSSSMPAPIAYAVTTEIEEPAEEEAIELAITNNTGMFKATTAYLYPDSHKLVITLSGKGYHNLFLGTYADAVANGDAIENWIAGDDSTGSWQFTIPLTEGVTYYPIVAVSNSYYEKYLKGTNPISRAFYPRQFEIDYEAKTLVTGDYNNTEEYSVTNNISMFKPADTSTLTTVGGPNSNGYKVSLNLAMQNTSFDQIFVGTYAEAAEAEETIALDENNQFSLVVEQIKTAGDPSSIISSLNQEVVVCFHAVKSGKWFERTMYIDTDAKTITLNTHNADYTAVDAAIASIPEDLSAYTDETAAAVTAAKDAVVTGKFASQQEEVDAMAEAIVKAVAALEKKSSISFEDVSEDSPFFEAITWAAENGVAYGKDAAHFAPSALCTRSQLVTFLWRAAGKPEPQSMENPFTDVADDASYLKAVLWAKEQGITVGKTAAAFAPDGLVNRAQAVTFLWRAAGEPKAASAENAFTDVSEKDYYYQAVLWAAEQGITKGITATSFKPNGACSRGQAVTLIYRAQ